MTMKFGFGQPLTRKEDDALLRGAGRYVADVAPAGQLACGGGALAARACALPDRRSRPRAGDAGRAPGADRQPTSAHLGPLPTPGVLPDVEIKVPPYPILARDVVRHVGDAVAFVVADTLDRRERCRRGDRRSTGSRCRMSSAPIAALEARRAAGLAGPARQSRLRDRRRRRGARPKDAFAKAARRSSSSRIVNQRLVTNYLDTRGVVAEYDGRPLHAHARQPGQPHHPRHHRRRRAEAAAGEDARRHARCRRRLRHQAVSLSRICAGRGRRRAAAQAGEMGLPSAPSIFSATATAATTSRPRGWRSTTRAASSRSSSTSSPTWAPICRAMRPIFPGSASAWRPGVYDIPVCACAPARGLHQHRAGRCLSRRRAAGSLLSDRAAGRCRRARSRHRA